MTDTIALQTIRVLCVDDHPLVRKGIAAILSNEADMELVGEASNGDEAVEQFRQLQPDVTLIDLKMPVKDGIAAVTAIRNEFPEARFIALTSYDGDHDVFRALEAGVRGYILKESVHTEILGAIRRVHSGGQLFSQDTAQRFAASFSQASLTPREIEVLSLVAQGFGNKEVAAKLGPSVGTVKIHVQNILAKLNATDRTHAVTIALKRGLIQLP
ncbi:Response regulator protein VraR [Caulifigura coniformis]|uniref:Response regulator protein VraR n=1 Tax=Caulifigura coniformis TaxID=2527983 RepID=A0A517SCB7_9PLAN|nr:response regulator transcription factor [Caulifigura coniformis]QDT53763.1 Response regulator protein VraR [Caulifigura coniformis]